MKKKIILGILGLTLSLTACSNETGEEKTTEEHIGKVFDTVIESSLGNYLVHLSKVYICWILYHLSAVWQPLLY